MNNYILKLAEKTEKDIKPVFNEIDEVSIKNHQKVLDTFRNNNITDFYFKDSTGYGYGDQSREKLDDLYSEIFGCEAAIVRMQFVSGTHAIWKAVVGIIKPGKEIVSASGPPYDTLRSIFSSSGYLEEWGISYKEVPLTSNGNTDLSKLQKTLTSDTQLVLIQRSRGYQERSSISIEEIQKIIKTVKNFDKEIICLVDNCYGEFVEEKEPTEVGADLIAGSLIKNPGGGLAPTGGYIAGKENLIKKAAFALTAPGLGTSIGASLTDPRILYQGLFLAPKIVSEALKGAVFISRLYELLEFEVSPKYGEHRTDIVQGVKLLTEERLRKFSKYIQYNSPIDSQFTPEPSVLPGYDQEIMMAAGTFVQGSSIEFSGDAPLKEPYWIYVQGGLSYEYIKLGILNITQNMIDAGLIS